MTEQIAHLMKTLDCTEAEALDILQQDKAIDRGKRVSFDLSKEDEKRAKKYANADTHKRPANPVHRERKPNEQKEAIIAELFEILRQNPKIQAENVEIANKNRQIVFSVGEKHYDLTLVEKRPPKK